MNKIEQIINDMEDYIDGCKKASFSSNKILVSKSDMEEYLRELRLKTPDEIKRYQKMLGNKDAIINDAKEQANQILSEAKKHTEELVSEHEIIQQAYQESERVKDEAYTDAQQTVDLASERASEIELNSIKYTDTILSNLQLLIEKEIETNKAKYESLIASLEQELSVVIANRRELANLIENPNGGSNSDSDTSDEEGYDGFDDIDD